MLQISAELLAMSSDAAVLIKNGKVAFANSGAYALLGGNCLGKTVKSLFGDDIAEVQAGAYIGEFPIGSKRYVVRVSSAEGIKAMFLSNIEDSESLISDAFIFSLRNCLMSIDISLSMLRNQPELLPEHRESLSVISHESYKINRILKNIFIIRSVRDTEMPLYPVSMNISEFIEELLNSLKIIADLPEIRFNAPPELRIYADPSLIECLFLNLISNCLIHAKDCTRISISITPGKERVFISVDDNGCGIAAEELHSVFDRYTHSFDMNDMSRGPGLGLTAARAIASIHGGTLLMESRQGIGTAVRVSLSCNPQFDSSLGHPLNKYEMNMKSLLTGLANCLPPECFSEKYMD